MIDGESVFWKKKTKFILKAGKWFVHPLEMI